ncbi:hypothetical protein DEAC_c39950 [Desulfosporosinus acididurans]|uniref:Rv2525c-like glycoside hydrolase-like domain-containing protein n=1 Tax=Desulfosporosinus acididurans TaxID=476652 RepID=A0A0J1IH63_9FIRM|nr:glycoside hydrolase domain-containing protein [Desulfosporosinus acididurans]KLU64001.1 hypothetical protein DEAC_c39950 [Desulfosporosinus acididurans]
MLGIDCGTRLNAATVQALKANGVKAVGRYLGHTLWNGLTVAEVKAIHDGGLLLWLILELSPTQVSYFTYDKGVSDAQFALAEAQALGAPKGACIYFTVDYEAQAGDMAAIKDYLHGVHTVLTGKFLVGVYGSYYVIEAAKGASYPPDRFYQTIAWSYKNVAPNDVYQYTNTSKLAGITVDMDYVNDNAGLWGPDGLYQVVKESEEEMGLDVAVLLNTKDDEWAGTDVAVKNGNCAMFVRPYSNGPAPANAMKAEHLIVVGGATTGHPNETLLSGDDKFGTAAAVKKYLG